MMIPTSLGRIVVIAGLLSLPQSLRAQGRAASLELDVTAPSGYVTRQAGGSVWLVPATPGDVSTRCNSHSQRCVPRRGPWKLTLRQRSSPRRLSRACGGPATIALPCGGLAAAAGTTFCQGATSRPRLPSASFILRPMAMVIPASANRVSVVVAFGSAAGCNFSDAAVSTALSSPAPTRRAISGGEGRGARPGRELAASHAQQSLV